MFRSFFMHFFTHGVQSLHVPKVCTQVYFGPCEWGWGGWGRKICTQVLLVQNMHLFKLGANLFLLCFLPCECIANICKLLKLVIKHCKIFFNIASCLISESAVTFCCVSKFKF